MRVDRLAFLAAVGAIAGCPREPQGVRGPQAPVQPTSATRESPPPPAASAAASSAADPTGALLAGFVDGLRAGGACEEQRFDSSPRPGPRAEGRAALVDAFAHQCDPLEYLGAYPTSCSEGAFGCTAVLNTVRREVGTRVLACLRAPRRPPLCGKPWVEECLLPAIAAAAPQARFETACQEVADACHDRGRKLSVEDCERYLSTMRKCHGFQRALSCLPDACDVRACVDDWLSTDSW